MSTQANSLAPKLRHVAANEGSWTNVVGLPLELLPALFAELGEALADWQHWKGSCP